MSQGKNANFAKIHPDFNSSAYEAEAELKARGQRSLELLLHRGTEAQSKLKQFDALEATKLLKKELQVCRIPSCFFPSKIRSITAIYLHGNSELLSVSISISKSPCDKYPSYPTHWFIARFLRNESRICLAFDGCMTLAHFSLSDAIPLVPQLSDGATSSQQKGKGISTAARYRSIEKAKKSTWVGTEPAQAGPQIGPQFRPQAGSESGAASESEVEIESWLVDPVRLARGHNSLEALLQRGRPLRAIRAATETVDGPGEPGVRLLGAAPAQAAQAQAVSINVDDLSIESMKSEMCLQPTAGIIR